MLRTLSEVHDFVSAKQPDEIYYLAAYHHSSEEIPNTSSALFRSSFDINTFGPLNFLEAIALNSRNSIGSSMPLLVIYLSLK